MAKGGYKGSSPARETSPEEYSGVWDITEQYGEQKTGSWPFQADDNAPKSLRFNASDSAYLSKTYAAAGNRKTWTWSGWVKRGSLSTNNPVVFSADTGNAPWTAWQFTQSDGTIQITTFAGTSPGLLTNASFRDPSAWYHIVIAMDTTQSTASDRVKLYVNGEQQTFSNTNYPAQNSDTKVNGAFTHYIGYTTNQLFDGLLSDVYLIDGQALSCEEFGFFDGQGLWMPKRFTGDYSSGPVYSNGTLSANPSAGNILNLFDGNIHPQQSSSGSSGNQFYIYNQAAITYTFPQPLTGTFKVYVGNGDWNGSSSNSGGTISLNTGASVTLPTPGTQFYYATVGAGTNVTSITFNPANGGILMGAIYVDDVQLVDASVGRNSFKLDFSDGAKDQSGLSNDWNALNLNLGGDFTYSSAHGSNVTTAEFAKMVDSDLNTYGEPSGDFIGFAFAGQKITVKIQNTAPDAKLFYIQPATNTSFNFANQGTWSVSGGSASGNQWTLNANSTETGTFTVPNNYAGTGRFYFSGNNTDFRIYDISPASDTESTNDISVDSPVNGNEASTGAGGQRRGNYATLSPLAGAQTLSNGNLDVTGGSSWQRSISTIAMSSGKYYWEYTITASNEHIVGVGPLDMQMSGNLGAGSPPGSGYGTETGYVNGTGANGSWSNTGGSTTGDVIGVAFDADAGNMYIYKNGTALNSGAASHTGLTNGPYYAVFSLNGSSRSGSVNFGQRPFKYQNAGTDRPSSNYKPLATSFLPEPTIKRGDEAMGVELWSGDGALSRQIKTKFSPDLAWLKVRNANNTWHHITDIVRGAPNKLYPNSASAEDTTPIYGQIDSLDSDGFTVGDGTDGSNPLSDVNQFGQTYVSWIWDGGDATTTIAAGGLNSSAYNTSQVWTNYSGDQTTKSPSNAFDGNSSTNFGFPTSAGNGNSGTFTFSITGANKIRIRAYTGYATTSNGGFEVNSVDIQSQITTTPQWITISGSSLSSIYMAKGNSGSGNFDPVLEAVEVDGKILVDSTATPSNVPLVATDVRARTDAGFSIAKWSKSANNQSYAHGLLQAPEFIIAKSLAGAHSWRAWHKDLSNNKNTLLDTNQAEDTYTDMIGIPDAYKVPLINGGPGATNGGMIAYNFHSVEGYCQIGSFVNPSSTEGAFAYCGFRPALIIAKCVKNISSSSGAGDWIIRDTARSPFNNPSDGNTLVINEPNAEDNYYTAGQAALDILSNGFKIRHPNSSPLGDPGRLYIFAAWAEHPFASQSRAR